jgi:hypothetical protein
VAERAGAAEFVPGDGWWCCSGQRCGHGVQFCGRVYFVQSAGLYDQAAAACDAAGNDTNSSLALYEATQVDQTKALTFLTAQAGSEALTLMLVSVAFVERFSLCRGA